jgi:hypothetical protein
VYVLGGGVKHEVVPTILAVLLATRIDKQFVRATLVDNVVGIRKVPAFFDFQHAFLNRLLVTAGLDLVDGQPLFAEDLQFEVFVIVVDELEEYRRVLGNEEFGGYALDEPMVGETARHEVSYVLTALFRIDVLHSKHKRNCIRVPVLLVLLFDLFDAERLKCVCRMVNLGNPDHIRFIVPPHLCIPIQRCVVKV